MSRFETGSLRNRDRNAAFLPDAPLATVPLAVPGLDVPELVTERSSIASSLLADLGLVARIGDTIADGVDRGLAFDREKRAAVEFAAERNRRAAEGAGIVAASKLMPELENILAQDTAIRSPQETRNLAESLLRSRLAGMDPVSIDAAVTRYAPSLIESGTSRVQKLRDAAAQEVVANLLATAPSVSGDDVGKLAEQINATDPSTSVTAARRAIAMKRLDAAAVSGDTEAFQAAINEAGVTVDENYVIERQAELEASLRRRASLADGAAKQEYAARAFNAGWKSVLDDVAKDPRLEPTTKLEIKSLAEAEDRRLLKDASDTYYETAVAAYTDQFRAAMADGASTGGASAILAGPDIKVRLPDGSEREINRQEVVDSIVVGEMERIRSTSASAEDFISRGVDYLSGQGSGVSYGPWRATLDGAASQLSTFEADAPLAEVPPKLAEAITLYRSLSAKEASGVLSSNLKDNDSRELLRSIDMFMSSGRSVAGEPGAMTMKQAVANAKRMTAARAFGRSTGVSTAALDEGVRKAVSKLGDVDNAADIEQAIRQKAEVYKLMGRATDEQAVDRAKKDVLEDWKNIDGTAVFTHGYQIPDDMEALVRGSKKAIAAKLGIKPDAVGMSVVNDTVYFTDEAGTILQGVTSYRIEDFARASRHIAGYRRAKSEMELVTESVRRRDAFNLAGGRTDAPSYWPGPIRYGINKLGDFGIMLGYSFRDDKADTPTDIRLRTNEAKYIPDGIIGPLFEATASILNEGEERDVPEPPAGI